MTAFHRAILASAAIVGLTAFAHPEARAADPKEWSLQRFRPAIHSFGAFTTEAARVSHGFTLNAFILANLAGPVLQDAAGDDVVERFGTSNLVVSAGFLDHLSVALDVPVHMLGSGRFLTGEDVQPAGLGDIRLSLKAAALRPYRTGAGLALAIDVFTPTGSSGAYGREEGVVIMPRLLLDAVARGAHMMANIFALVRSSPFTPEPAATAPPGGATPPTFGPNLRIGSDFGTQAAVAVFLGSPDVRMIFEGRLESRLARFFEPDSTALEGSWGLQWRSEGGFAVGGGASFGFLGGHGDPDWRGFLSVGYQPARFIPEAIPVTDRDGDGIDDKVDECPVDPEDKDGFEDEDGCPDPDNDRDGISDNLDKCPLAPENFDGFDDGDGCPDVRGDADGDGVYDDLDRCPKEPEDKDGVDDGDGCPDIVGDADGDGLPDPTDRCPQEAEDKDAFEDQDGCPDLDNDKDGVLDAADKCPMAAEDFDGFEDDDGCPETDNDQDGLADASDRCPQDPEDKDGFEDQDGCPELDNDKDGVLDAADMCPLVAEDLDGCQDEDGCPEEGRVCVTREKIVITDKIFFATNKAEILPQSYPLIEEIAKVLNENAHIELIEVQGHTDSQGNAAYNTKLSAARAESVRNRLIMVGRVDPVRLQARGFGPDVPIADNKTKEGRDLNRRVEFMILRQKVD
jgi:OOP family OmpA-OmpF porin